MTSKITLSLAIGLLIISFTSNAQSVGIGTETPNANAILELVAPSNNQGLLVPRLTTAQRTAASFTDNLGTAENGLLVYDSDENIFYFWMNTSWVELSTGNLTGLPDQTGQNGRFLSTDGVSAGWSQIDFSSLVNIPNGISDGDDVEDADADSSNEIQDLSLSANTLSLSGSASTIDLSAYLDNTDSQDLAFISGVITLSGDPDGTSIDLSTYDSDVSDDFDGDFLSLTSIPSGLLDGDDVNDADSDASNEIQDLSLSANTLSLSGSSTTIDLSAYMDNTDAQDLAFNSGVITLSGDPDATSIDLSTYDTDVSDDFDGVFSSLTSIPSGLSDGDDVDDADADPSNEFQDLTLSGNTLSLTNSSVDVDLTPFAGTNTDNQTLSLSGTDLTITGGNTLDVSSLVNDADSDPNNENQTVSAGTGISVAQSGDNFEVTNTAPDQTVALTNGGNVTISGTYPNFTLSVPTNNDNSSTNEIQDISTDGTAGDISLSSGSSITLNVDDADADPNNENQTVSAGTGISVAQSGDDFEVTNTAPDQTVSLTNGGNVTISGTYPNFTLSVPTNNDNSSTNEIQDISTDGTAGDISLSGGSSITLNVDDADASSSNELNTSLVLSSTTLQLTDAGGTLSQDLDGTFATDVELAASDAADADKSASNELQDLSLTTNTLSLSGSAATVDLSGYLDNTDEQALSLTTNTLSISGSAATVDLSGYMDNTDAQDLDFTGGVITLSGDPDATSIDLSNYDSDVTDDFQLPTQTGQSGNFLTTDGSSPSWSAINESQWTTNGTSINYTSGNVNIGSGTIPTSRLQLTTNNANSTTPQLRINESDASSDASMNFNGGGVNFTLGVDGSDNYFKISESNVLGNNNRIIIDNTGSVGIGTAPNGQFHVQTNSIESHAIRVNNDHSGAGVKMGLYNIIDNQGSSDKYGVYNDIDGTTSSTGTLAGVWNVITPTDGPTWGVSTIISSAGTGRRHGYFANISVDASNTFEIYGTRSTITNNGSGVTYGSNVDIATNGTGIKYGNYINVLGNNSSSAAIYGSRANVTNSGSGTTYGYYANVNTSGGTMYGFHSVGDALNFFEGNVGIGGDLSPTHQLSILSTVTNSTLPMVRVRAGNTSSDASVYMNIQGGTAFTYGIDADNGNFKISNASVLGVNDRLTMQANGAMTLSNTLQVTGQITGLADVQIPNTSDYTYDAAKTYQLVYHPTEFSLVRTSSDGVEILQGASIPYMYFSGGSGLLARASIPLKLPQGAVITDLEARVVDNNSSQLLRVQIIRTLYTNVTNEDTMANVETTALGASTTVQALSTSTVLFPTIDNDSYSYRLVYSGADNVSTHQLHGVRITYTVLQAD